MVAYTAGIVVFLMSFVIKGDKIHSCIHLQLAGFFPLRLKEDNVRLFSIHPGNELHLLNSLLTRKIVASSTLHGSQLFLGIRCRFLGLGQVLLMTVDARDMRGESHGNPILLRHLLVAVATGAFLFLGVVKLLSCFIILVVAKFTFVLAGL